MPRDAAAVYPLVVITGPTGIGKSALAAQLARQYPVEIISADSAQIYRGMDIGTAKPGKAERQAIRYHLLDIRDPAESYSAGEFRRDALALIAQIRARGNLPLCVGGTLLYLRALLRGIARLPQASAQLRRQLDARAAQDGWPALHKELAAIDPDTAARVHENDAQRIQRALEVHQLTGSTMSVLQRDAMSESVPGDRLCYALWPSSREFLHRQIASRLGDMYDRGFVAEVESLHARGDLTDRTPAVRAVGYRQIWAQLAGKLEASAARNAALAASRQLAKRQMTWLRREPEFRRLLVPDEDAATRVANDVKALLA
ncbi:MAG: tRNA (adenosine(37)-N6)-dimethylallyltransferase MiaA [Steroidobacteraceae bacterium]